MTNKNIIVAVVIVAVLVFGIYLLSQPSPYQTNKAVTSSYNPQTQGKVVFGVTDATSDIKGVSSVLVTVNQVQVHSAVNGWVTVSNETKQYDLLTLKQSGAISLLANADINAGTYDQFRMMVSKVVVVKNGIEQEAKLPSGELKIVGNIVINADKTSSIVFDFMADKSLHMTGNGKFIFAPVVKVSKRSDTKVEIKSNGEVDITGGNQENDQNVGMDSKGEVKDNFELKGNLNIDLNNNIQGEDNSSQGNNQNKIEIKNNLSL